MCGADGWEDIEEYGKAQAAWFAEVLDFPHGIAGPETLRRVLARLAPDALPQCFLAWTAARRARSGGDSGALDGNPLRHALERAAAQAAIHMVRAWAHRNRLVLGQVKVDDKAKAMTAMPQLLKMLDVTAAPVPSEAMGCQQEIAKVLTAQGADDVLALQKNHSTLDDDVTLWLDEARAKACTELDQAYHDTVAGDHGRLEIRQSGITAAIDWGGAQASWANGHSWGMVESRREPGEKVEIDRRYSRVSLPADGVRFSDAVRQPWGVENPVPWGLDGSCAEEARRMRKDQGAQTCRVLRHRAVHLLRRESQHTRGIKARRKRAGWDRDYLLQVLTA